MTSFTGGTGRLKFMTSYEAPKLAYLANGSGWEPHIGVKRRRIAVFLSALNTFHTSICYYKPINQEKPCFLEKFEIFNTTQQLLQFLVSCKDLEVFFYMAQNLSF